MSRFAPQPDPYPTQHDHHRYAREVRSQMVWAAISAALLLYYGWGRGHVTNLIVGAAILDWTCKIGGIAMLLSTLLLLTGRRVALLFDGVASLAIGAGIILGGILWLGVGVDFQGMLFLVFGYMFGQSGWHSYSLWVATGTQGTRSAAMHEYDSGFEDRYAQARRTAPSSSLASRLRQRETDEPSSHVPQVEPQVVDPQVSAAESESEVVDWSVQETGQVSEAESPSEIDATPADADHQDEPDRSDQTAPPGDALDGFLASFANPDDRKPRKS